MNTYIADYTDNRTKRKIKLALVAVDYLEGLGIARKTAINMDYRFDDLTFKSKLKKR